jgi:hypothetical protein
MIRLDEAANRGIQQNPRQDYLRVVPQIARPVISDLPSRYVAHLYSSSFCLNNFTGRPFDGFDDVCSLLDSSPSLYNAAIAVAAMDVRRQRIPSLRSPEASALQHYRTAISSVQTELVDRNVGANDSILWSTFFLGVFEVCRLV